VILVPNETAWLFENVGGFKRDVFYDTVYGRASQLEICVCIPMKESSRFGGDTDAIGINPADGTGENRDLGFCQISNKWNPELLQQHRWRDPHDNVRMFRRVFDDAVRYWGDPAKSGYRGPFAGFTPWKPFNKELKDASGKVIGYTWGEGVWGQMLAPARIGIKAPFEPANPYEVAWKR
jgi:hypothetical protein